MRAKRAASAASASGPSAASSIVEPIEAPSIISPMIERPETVFSPLVTLTSHLKRATVSTNLAEARACSPRLLTILAMARAALGLFGSESCIPSRAAGKLGRAGPHVFAARLDRLAHRLFQRQCRP